MEQLWSKVQFLAGKTLVTVKGARFKVIDLTERTVLVQVKSTNKHERIHRGQIEMAATVGDWATLRPGVLRAAGVNGSTGYIAGILRTIG